MLRITALLCALTLMPASLAAQVLTGRVIDSADGQPVSGAEVQLIDAAGEVVGSTLGSDTGDFRLEAPEPGRYTLQVRRVGYAPLLADSVPLVAEEPTEVEVRLGVDAVPLEPVVVVAGGGLFEPAWLTGFRDRAETNRRLGRGRIYTRADIDRIRPINALQMLNGITWRGRCEPVILLDGLPADASLGAVRGEDLEGVEIYRGASQIPFEYYREGMCGMILFWRRVDPPGMRPLTWARVAAASVVLLLLGLVSGAF